MSGWVMNMVSATNRVFMGEKGSELSCFSQEIEPVHRSMVIYLGLHKRV